MHKYSPAAYVALFTIMSERARKVGYALCMHGSLETDLDVVAIPWTEWAYSAEELIANLVKVIVIDPVLHVTPPVDKPQGRRAWTLSCGAGARIDLSIMPIDEPTVRTFSEQAIEAARDQKTL